MKFVKGQSGNPAGRPRGARNKATIMLENMLHGDAEAIISKAVELAKVGDPVALRICMDRLAPRRANTVDFELPPLGSAADTVAAAASIVAAVAAGDLTPGEAADLAKAIDIYLRALATTAFEQRLAKLEGTGGHGALLPEDGAPDGTRPPACEQPRGPRLIQGWSARGEPPPEGDGPGCPGSLGSSG